MLISAAWHGIYPGYILCFVHITLCLQISQEIYRIGKVR
jgi:hypothetical protein